MIETFKEAKLLPHEVAKALGVSRVAVSGWYNGHSNPHHLHAAKVQNLVDAVREAIDSGSLPVPHDVVRRERWHYISTALELGRS